MDGGEDGRKGKSYNDSHNNNNNISKTLIK